MCFITVGYASLNQILKLVGYASIDKGDGVIFTNIVKKENIGATIVTDGNIKAKTLVNIQVSFDKPGSITYTITAKNEAEYDAQLIEIKDLELTNNKEPKCITVSINGHEINDKIYTGATKEFDITITSTCNTLKTKEISLKFNYIKTDTINGEVPIPTIGSKSEELLQNSESTYNYLDGMYLGGSQSTNYVWFNGFMWRIMGKNADGSIRMITEENVTGISWGANNTAEQYDSSYASDWLNNYFYPKLKNKEYLVKQTWCSETTTSSSSARTTCSNNLSTTPQYVGLLSLDEYNLASKSSSYLKNSQQFWTLTPYSASDAWIVRDIGSAYNNSLSYAYGLRPVINVSSEITITGGNGTPNSPYELGDPPETFSQYLINNKLNTDVSNSNAIGLYGINDSGNLTTSSSPREYRYVGKTPNNYIKFNNELWQIIGIFDNKIKIIRTHSLGKYLVGDIRNFYEGQATFDYLNGEYYNSIVGKEKINKSTYYTYSMAFTGYTRNEIYNREMNYYSKEVQANIYYTAASDYAFSVSPSCMSMLDSYSSCASVNWMVNNEKFIIYGFSGGSRDSQGTIVLENGGTGAYSIFMSPTEVDIRPVLYLKEDVYYASGTGTSSDPYILE